MQPGQHRRGASTEHPHCEEDNEQGRGEHHLPGICGGVTDGQRERHRPSESYREQTHTHVFSTQSLMRMEALLQCVRANRDISDSISCVKSTALCWPLI